MDKPGAVSLLGAPEVESAPDVEQIDSVGFFERGTASQRLRLSDALVEDAGSQGRFWRIPDPINLRCFGSCAATRKFSPDDQRVRLGWNSPGELTGDFVVTYRCRECRESLKMYSVNYLWTINNLRVAKYGEIPQLTVTVSKKMLELLRPDMGLFQKALQAEAAGLGIGALVYYRRILENQKARIFKRVLDAARRIGADPAHIKELEAASTDRQFTKAMEALSGGPLRAIYMRGENPLALLYDELSDGVHAGTDHESLEEAENIRTVLGHLAERLDQVLADHADVDKAVQKLIANKSERAQRKRDGGQDKGEGMAKGDGMIR